MGVIVYFNSSTNNLRPSNWLVKLPIVYIEWFKRFTYSIHTHYNIVMVSIGFFFSLLSRADFLTSSMVVDTCMQEQQFEFFWQVKVTAHQLEKISQTKPYIYIYIWKRSERQKKEQIGTSMTSKKRCTIERKNEMGFSV